jgi:transposase InsO family protein/transposase-like protein
MPWKEICPMDQKIQLLSNIIDNNYTVTELSQIYQVSRKTIYKWKKRYHEQGSSGLEERSRTPFHHPNATGPKIVNQLIDTKLQHRTWGPKKIIARLEKVYPQFVWPAPSTAGSILKKEGLVNARHLRRQTPPYTQPFQDCTKPNDVWSIDYKGQFRLGDNRLCYPFTISDNYSRFLLGCRGLYHPSYENTKPWLERTFREYGLPLAIRSDNGAPFASVGLGGLSALAVWLIKLWIRPERIEVGHPEQNGRHERMHRTLKAETASPPRSNLPEQQKAFDGFRMEYNTQRPHEALGQEVPAAFYLPSRRLLPRKSPEVEYASWYIVRKVRHNGCIKWKGHFVYVSQALAGEPIGLRQINDAEWELFFSFYSIGILDEHIFKVLPITREKVLPMSPV